jgi:Rhs element Vgr protein
LANPPVSPPREAHGSTPQEVSMALYDWNFSTSASGQGTDKFRILAFTGEDSVCQGYRFDILLLADTTESAAQTFLDNMAAADIHTLQVTVNTTTPHPVFTWTGMPERVEWLFSATGGGCVMRVQLRPHSFKLRLGVHSRIFLDVAVPNLLANLLIKEDFVADSDFTTVGLRQNYKKRPISCQYNESSFNFLLRHLERVGGYSYIEQNGATDRLVLADGDAQVPALPGQTVLDWDPTRAQPIVVSSFARSRASCPGAVTLRDYSTEWPGTESQTFGTAPGACAVNYFGQFNMFGETDLDTTYSTDDTEAQALLMAKARLRSLASRSNLTRGESTVAWMRAGYYFTLSGQNYQILTTSCVCNCCVDDNDRTNVSRAAGFGFTVNTKKDGYNNSFTCHSLALDPFAPEITAQRPVVSGLTHAVIHAADGTSGYADIDAMGRYLVLLPFPEGVYGTDNVSIRLRMAQINASSRGTVHSGVHLPLLNGTEVLVGFTDGDPDRPVIMAALPNTNNPSVVNDSGSTDNTNNAYNNRTNVIRTPGGHTLTLDDTDNLTKITLTSQAGHTLTLDDSTNAPKITLTSQAGHTLTLDDNTTTPKITLESKGNTAKHTLTLDDNPNAPKISIKSQTGHELTLDDNPSASNITLHSSSGHFLEMDDHNKTVTLQASDKTMSIVFDVAEGSLKMKSGDQSTTLFKKLGKYLETGTHKESLLGGNSTNIVLGGSEAVNVGLKAAVSLALNETLNLGFNLVQNIGANATVNLGPTMAAHFIGANALYLSKANIAASDAKLSTQLTRLGLSATQIAALTALL